MADTRRLRGISEGWKAGWPSARLQSGGKAQCPLSRTAESPLEEARDSRVLHGLPSGPLAAQAGRCHPRPPGQLGSEQAAVVGRAWELRPCRPRGAEWV